MKLHANSMLTVAFGSASCLSIMLAVTFVAVSVGRVPADEVASDKPAAKRAGPGHKQHTFAEIIRAHFANWDQNHDGKLDTQELDAAVNRPGLHNEVAAALATIKTRERKAMEAKLKNYAATQEELLQEVDHSPNPELDRAMAAGDPGPFRFQTVYEGNLKGLAHINHQLYVGEGPSFSAMHQGFIGDCFFFSVVGNIVAHQPNQIKRMIVPDSERSYSVHFGDGEQLKVQHPSDIEIAINNSIHDIEDGIWLTILEKAVGRRIRTQYQNAPQTKEATDDIAFGGDSSYIIAIFTGHEVNHFWFRKNQPAAQQQTELRHALTEAFANRRLVAVSMAGVPPAGSQKIPGLGYGHAYAMFGFDSHSDHVQLWNPWGNDFKPNGPPGVQHGFETKHGLFEVPLTTLYDQFEWVGVESTKKHEPQKPPAHPHPHPHPHPKQK